MGLNKSIIEESSFDSSSKLKVADKPQKINEGMLSILKIFFVESVLHEEEGK
jgi:hypothetical protein